MDLDEIKKEMINYRDMFGGDLLEVANVKDAATKEELAAIIDSHNDHMELMLNDAQSSLNRFKRRIGLYDI